MKLLRKIVFLSSGFFLYIAPAQADSLRSIPEFVHLHAAPEFNWSGSVGTLPPVASFAGFSEGDIGRWLTVTLGPEYVNLVGGRSASFTGRLNADQCRVVNTPVPMMFQDWDEKDEFYKLKTRQLQNCVQYRIRDVSGIEPAAEQFACQVYAVNPFEVVARGGVCYFRINPHSSFSVQYELNPECTDERNFQRLGLSPLDMFAFNGFYLSGDASGQSSTLIPLGSGLLRFSIQAPVQQVRLSADMGDSAPRWPVLAFPDVHMGDLMIEKNGRQSMFMSQLFFKNLCPSDNVTPCRYSTPVGIQFSLKEILPDGRDLFLDQWYSGALAPAFWEGFFRLQRDIRNFEFKPGSRYRLEADLTYLSVNYRLFREGFRDFLVQQGLWTIDPNLPLRPLPPIAVIPGLDSLKAQPLLPVVSPLSSAGGNDLELELSQLRALLKGVDWPPYFESMCGDSGCADAISGQAKLKVGVEFTVDGFENGRARTVDYRVWRESSFASEYNKETNSLMKADCQ